MTPDRKKPGVAFWATVTVVVALVGYPLSFGPACWLTSRTNAGASSIPVIYRPITRSAEASATIKSTVRWHARLFAPTDWVLWQGEDEWSWGRMMMSRPSRAVP